MDTLTISHIVMYYAAAEKLELLYQQRKITKEEMQRFLIKEAQRGSTEMEAYRNLMEILGIEFPNEKKEPIE